MYDNDSLPTFYHGREAHVIHQFRGNKHKTSNSPRKPLSQQTLISIINSIRQKESRLPPIIRKISLNKTLKNYAMGTENFEESLDYNHIELTQSGERIKVLLIDSSYSMSNYSSVVNKLSKEVECDLVLYHDTDLFDYELAVFKPTKYIGGTNYYRTIKKLVNTSEKFHITHLTDGETTVRDQEQTIQLIQQSNGDVIYSLISVKSINF